MTSVFPLKSETADTTHINFDTFLIMKFYTSTGRRTLRTSILIIYDVQYIGIRKKEYTTPLPFTIYMHVVLACMSVKVNIYLYLQ